MILESDFGLLIICNQDRTFRGDFAYILEGNMDGLLNVDKSTGQLKKGYNPSDIELGNDGKVSL